MALLNLFRRFVPRKFRLLLYLFLILLAASILLLFYDINFKSGLPHDANRENGVLRNIEKLKAFGKYIPQDNRDQIRNSTEINVMIIFTNADGNYILKRNFERLCTSLLMHSSVALAMHIVGDAPSRKIASDIITKASSSAKVPVRVIVLDLNVLVKRLNDIVELMQKHFSFKPGSYYGHALFFLSIAMHVVMPKDMNRVIVLDSDLKVKDDILELHDHFSKFSDDNVMGIAHEMQPVYRHIFHMYRNKNPATRVGNPPPDGLTGFNSGVLLLNLERMRNSVIYNSMLNANVVGNLTAKYLFKGHLGDQDFFSLISLEHENLFYILPCNWNYQLCVWWKNNGYSEVFDLYHKCNDQVKIYHMNCNTQISDNA